MKEPKVHLSGG